MLIELESRDTIMKKEIDNNKPIEKKPYVPPANHPWRKSYKKITSWWLFLSETFSLIFNVYNYNIIFIFSGTFLLIFEN